LEQAEIVAREETEKRRMAQTLLLNQTRITGEEKIRKQEIERQKTLEVSRKSAARELVERARITPGSPRRNGARIAAEDRRIRELEIDASEIHRISRDCRH
jgi:membrane protein involved in colicin uptake